MVLWVCTWLHWVLLYPGINNVRLQQRMRTSRWLKASFWTTARYLLTSTVVLSASSLTITPFVGSPPCKTRRGASVVGHFACMHPAVPHQVAPLAESLGTMFTPVRPLARVCPHVAFHEATGTCRVGAQAAPEPPGHHLRQQVQLARVGHNHVSTTSMRWS